MRSCPRCARQEQGFTLVEILIVTAIIGLLASIAIPTFLGQREKGDDAIAKSDVNRVAKMVEECRVEARNYSECNERSELNNAPGMDWGTSAGQSGVLAADDDSFIAYSISKAKTNGRNHVFAWFKQPDGVAKRLCTDTSLGSLSAGGCRGGEW